MISRTRISQPFSRELSAAREVWLPATFPLLKQSQTKDPSQTIAECRPGVTPSNGTYTQSIHAVLFPRPCNARQKQWFTWCLFCQGLLRCAQRHRCSGIKTALAPRFSDPAANRWVFRAIVYGSNRLKSFVGYGDADPSNVSSMVRGAEMRVAETRAVNRALRKAYHPEVQIANLLRDPLPPDRLARA